MTSEEIAVKKAELIHHGRIHVPPELRLPFYPSRSTAGPGAGRKGIVIGFGSTRVKLAIVRDESSLFSLRQVTSKGGHNKYAILKHGATFLDEVTLEPTVMHAPRQAFINITSNCIYDCSFCVTPKLDKSVKECTPERWVELILARTEAEGAGLEAVAITSGVAETPHNTVLDMVKVIKGVRAALPEMPIGVEPYVTSTEDVDLLHQAGASEIKINLESATRETFEKVCRGLDYDGVKKALRYSVSVFGRNRVCSNIIVGLGETDEEILTAVEGLAKSGVVATLRSVRVNELNAQKLEHALGFQPMPVQPEKLLDLARGQKEILDKHGLSTREFKTMCHRCGACDIVPQQDI